MLPNENMSSRPPAGPARPKPPLPLLMDLRAREARRAVGLPPGQLQL